MAEIITKFNDYDIQIIEFFISAIEDELEYRDLKGLTNNKTQIINVKKQHPLVELMASQLAETRGADPLRSGILPSISVTPGNVKEGGFTLAKGPETGIVDDDFISDLQTWIDKETFKEIIQECMITRDQLDLILSEYNREDAGTLRYIRHIWHKNEEVNISLWTENSDSDILLGILMDSILTNISVGFMGDESKIKNLQYTSAKGLTNFNFGRVIFGSEYNLTFTNTYSNYTIYKDDVITDHDLNGTFEIPGEE